MTIDRDLFDDEESLLSRRGGDVDLDALFVLALKRLRGDERGPRRGRSLVSILGTLGGDDARLVATRSGRGPALHQRTAHGQQSGSWRTIPRQPTHQSEVKEVPIVKGEAERGATGRTG